MIEIVVFGTPVSQQTRRRDRVRAWSEQVRQASMAQASISASMETAVHVMLTHYFRTVRIDVDNLAKPILDSLKGRVIVDDVLVEELTIRRVRVRPGLIVRSASPKLVDALASQREFVHITIVRIAEMVYSP